MALRTPVTFLFPRGRIDRHSGVPIYRQIGDALREAILEGRLQADDPLPSTRQLAADLHASRITVEAAYELLSAEGYIVRRGGAGTFVAQDAARTHVTAQERREPRPLSDLADILRVFRVRMPHGAARPFRATAPAYDAFPTATWSRILARHARESSSGQNVDTEPMGNLKLRKAIAQRLLKLRSSDCPSERILIVSNNHIALLICAALLVNADDPVWVEEPADPTCRNILHLRTKLVVPVTVDAGGLSIEAGKALSPNPRMIFVTPTHQWPLGVTMPVQRRLALLDFANQQGAWVVEYDYDGDLRFDGMSYATLLGLDKEHRVIHIGSFTEAMYPGFGLAYIVVPPDLVDAFAAACELGGPAYPTVQAGLAEFIELGHYGRHVHEMQALYKERHELLSARIHSKLANVFDARPAVAGTFTLAEFRSPLNDVEFAARLRAEGLESIALSSTYAGQPAKHGLLLGHAIATPEEIRNGVDGMARLYSAWLAEAQRSLSGPKHPGP